MVQVLKDCAFLIGGAILGLAILKFFLSSAVLLILFGFVGFILMIVKIPVLVNKDLNWILVLPISKRRILAFKYGFTLLSLLLFVISYLSVALAVLTIEGSLGSFLTQLSAAAAWSNADLADMVLLVFGFGGALHSVGMHFAHRESQRRLMSSLTRRKRLLMYLFCFLSCLWMITWLHPKNLHQASSFFIESMLVIWVVAAVTSPYSASFYLCLPNRIRNRLITASVAFALIPIGIVYLVVLSGLESSSVRRQIESIELVGTLPRGVLGQVWETLGLGVSKSKVAKLLETELRPEEFWKLSRFYLDTYFKGNMIRKSQDQDLHFEALVNAKRSISEFHQVVWLFDPSDFDSNDLKLIFDRMQFLSQGKVADLNPLLLLRSKSTPSALVEFLKSSNPLAVRYALFRSRYDRDPSLIPAIEARLPELSDELRMSALKTLSVLVGAYVGLDAFLEYRTGKRIPGTSSFFSIDCSRFRPSTLDEVAQDAAPALNLCIRERADRINLKLLDAIEKSSWILPPFSESQLWAIKEVFHLK